MTTPNPASLPLRQMLRERTDATEEQINALVAAVDEAGEELRRATALLAPEPTALPPISDKPSDHQPFESKVYKQTVCPECSWLEDGHVVPWPCTYAAPEPLPTDHGHRDCPDGPDAHEDFCLNGRRE